MTHDESIRFLLQVALILATAIAFGQVTRRLGWPAVLGELLGGILLGPTVFGAFAPLAHEWLLPSAGLVAAGREALAKLGLLSFLFAAGLELNLTLVRARIRAVAWTSLLGILIPFALGYAMVALVPGLFPASNAPRVLALFMGTALSISALPVIARILMDLNLQRTELASVILAAATLDDCVGWALFGAILTLAAPAAHPGTGPLPTVLFVFVLFGLALTLGRGLVRRGRPFIRAHIVAPGSLIGIAAVVCLLASAVVESLGVHAVFGAFLVGLALAQGRAEREYVHEVVYQFATGVFAPIYFVTVGLRADFGANLDLTLAACLVVVATVGKVVGAGLGAWIGRMPPRQALAVGFGMNARGAMEIILATLALEAGLIEARLFVALVVMAFVTTLMSGPVVARLVAPRQLPLTARPEEGRPG